MDATLTQQKTGHHTKCNMPTTNCNIETANSYLCEFIHSYIANLYIMFLLGTSLVCTFQQIVVTSFSFPHE
jgi:hypothetical protein